MLSHRCAADAYFLHLLLLSPLTLRIFRLIIRGVCANYSFTGIDETRRFSNLNFFRSTEIVGKCIFFKWRWIWKKIINAYLHLNRKTNLADGWWKQENRRLCIWSTRITCRKVWSESFSNISFCSLTCFVLYESMAEANSNVPIQLELVIFNLLISFTFNKECDWDLSYTFRN